MEEIDTTLPRFRDRRGELFLRCVWCNEPLAFEAGRGWVHSEGGGATYWRCGDCGAGQAPRLAPRRCDKCGSAVLMSHLATPPSRKA